MKQRLADKVVRVRAAFGLWLGVLVIATAAAGTQAADPGAGVPAASTAAETATQPAPAPTATPTAVFDAADENREKGIHALNDGIYEAAIRFFLKYREATGKKEPAFTDATALLVQACLRARRVDEAQRALLYHKQHSKGPADPYYRDQLIYWTAKVQLAVDAADKAIQTVSPLVAAGRTPEFRNLALELIGDASIIKKDWPRAEEAYRRLLQEFPEAANADRVRLSLAYVLIAENKTADARTVLAEYEARHPTEEVNVRARLLRGLIALREGKVADALELYRAIADQRPTRPDQDWWRFLSELVDALMAAGKYEDALTVAPGAQLTAPSLRERIEVRLKAINCFIALKRPDPAITALAAFEKEFGTVPSVYPVLFGLGLLLREQGSFQTAVEYFNRVAGAENVPTDLRYKAALQKGWCYADDGRDEDAMRAFSEAAKLGRTAQEKARALFLAGEAAYRVGNYTGAALYFQTVADKYRETSFAEEARYKQALCRFQAKLFSAAAATYAQFLKEYPKSAFADKARVERGVALRNAGDFAAAARELAEFAETHPDSPLAPRALLEAAQAARSADEVDRALQLYSKLLERYPDSDLAPHALYQRAHLYFFETRFEEALKDCEEFLKRYPRLPMAADILFWLGDYYADSGDLGRSEEYYMRLVTTQPESPDAPTALYEAARSAYRRGDLLRADLLLQQFEREHPDAPAPLRARVRFLEGDILAAQGKFRKAAGRFEKAAELAAGSAFGAAARGRLGDMYYSLAAGSDNKEPLKEAAEVFQSIVDDPTTTPDIKDMARYRLAKTFEKMGNIDAAITEYLNVVYGYRMDLRTKRIRDWYYFARSGYDAARLLVAQKRFREAARLYERIAAAGIPTAPDALARAREIRRAHNLEY